MSDVHVGKLSPSKTSDLLGDSFGAPTEKLVVGPGPGLDSAILRLDDGRIMAVAEDPIFPAVGLPLELMGWFTAHIGASDVAVTGVKPTHMTYTLLLPPGCPESDAKTIVTSISDAARDLGISIVGGHTGWYGAVTIPTVGGVTVWGFAEDGEWISPGGAQDGDVMLMTKGPSIEATALLAVLYRERLSGKIDDQTFETLLSRTNQISVVEDALTAFTVEGVHAMHDATEGGVLGGLYEMSAAAGIPIHADLDAVEVPADIARFADVLGFDPWAAISEGTLLAAVSPEAVDAVMRVWAEKGIQGYVLGRFGGDGPSSVRRDGVTAELGEPGADPFWPLFSAGVE